MIARVGDEDRTRRRYGLETMHWKIVTARRKLRLPVPGEVPTPAPTVFPVTGGGGWADNRPIMPLQMRNGDKTARGWAKGGCGGLLPREDH